MDCAPPSLQSPSGLPTFTHSLGTPTSPAGLHGAVPRAAELTPGHSKGAVLAWHLLRVLGGEALRKKSRLHRGRSGPGPCLRLTPQRSGPPSLCLYERARPRIQVHRNGQAPTLPSATGTLESSQASRKLAGLQFLPSSQGGCKAQSRQHGREACRPVLARPVGKGTRRPQMGIQTSPLGRAPPRTMLGYSVPSGAWRGPSSKRHSALPLLPTPGLAHTEEFDMREGGSLKARLRIKAKRDLWGQQALAPKQGTPQTHRE